MIPNNIIKLMELQVGHTKRENSERDSVESLLHALGLSNDSEIGEFFLTYKLSGVLSDSSNKELLDIASPTPQILEETEFVRETYEVTDEFVCLTSSEGEGFFLFSIKDHKIYDLGVEDLDLLEEGNYLARWTSFYELIEWYLS